MTKCDTFCYLSIYFMKKSSFSVIQDTKSHFCVIILKKYSKKILLFIGNLYIFLFSVFLLGFPSFSLFLFLFSRLSTRVLFFLFLFSRLFTLFFLFFSFLFFVFPSFCKNFLVFLPFSLFLFSGFSLSTRVFILLFSRLLLFLFFSFFSFSLKISLFFLFSL